MEFESLGADIKNKIIKQVTVECKRFVIGALYDDFDGKPDEMTRETLKMFKWRRNPKKFCWYNKNTAENKALAESLNKSTDEMKDKKIPESYSEKYDKKETESSIDIKSFVDSLFKASDEEEKKTLKVTAQAVKKSQKVSKKIIDIDDDNFELDL